MSKLRKLLLLTFALTLFLIGNTAHAAVAHKANSAMAASTGADVTVTLPAHAANDIFLLQVLVRDTDDTITVSGWTEITNINDGTGKHWWFWMRASGSSETNPLVDKNTTSGDTYATVTTYSGADTAGDPWEANATTCTGTADPFSLTGISSLTANALIIASWNDRDNASASATYTPTDPSSLTSNMFLKSNVGADGITASGSALKTGTGATGSVSVNPSKAPDGACGIVLSLKPISGSLSVDIVDSGGTSVTTPAVAFASQSVSFTSQTSTGTLGIAAEKIRVTNTTGSAQWSLSIAATNGSTSFWNGTVDYDFNDPTASAGDGSDDDSLGGQMTIDPSGATITPEGGCATTGLTLGTSEAFDEEAANNDVDIVTAGATAETGCFWDITGISLSQTIPAEQGADSYAIDMTLTVVAV